MIQDSSIDGTIFRQVWDNAFDAMRLVDSAGRILMVNDAFCRMVNLPKEKLIGKSISVIYRDEYREKIHNKLVKKIEKDEIKEEFERFLILWNKREVWFEVSNTFIYSKEGNKNLLSIFRDISDRKKAEDEIHRYAKELESINVTKNKFFSLISHDLRGSFQSLLGLTDLMAEEIDTLSKEELSEYIGSLQRTLKAQYALLENLLSWSRLQTGQVQVASEEMVLDKEIRDVLALMDASFKSKSIAVNVTVPSNISLKTDKKMFKSTIRNLLSNAVKFTPEGGEIVIGADEADSCYRIYVRDNGVGMDEKVIESIFDVTNNFSNRGTKGEKGTGLGLAICKEMTELQGGKIEVESAEGKGSTFTIVLPGLNGKERR